MFYVKDMSSKPRKHTVKSDDEPKRHIVFPGKQKNIGVEDISDKSEDFDQLLGKVRQRGRSLFTPRSRSRDVPQKENCKCSINVES